jgi:hypothetical protein
MVGRTSAGKDQCSHGCENFFLAYSSLVLLSLPREYQRPYLKGIFTRFFESLKGQRNTSSNKPLFERSSLPQFIVVSREDKYAELKELCKKFGLTGGSQY